MPVTPTYPGVYVEEIPSGVHTITGVATSIAAFVDFFTRGPIDTRREVLSIGRLRARVRRAQHPRARRATGSSSSSATAAREAWVGPGRRAAAPRSAARAVDSSSATRPCGRAGEPATIAAARPGRLGQLPARRGRLRRAVPRRRRRRALQPDRQRVASGGGTPGRATEVYRNLTFDAASSNNAPGSSTRARSSSARPPTGTAAAAATRTSPGERLSRRFPAAGDFPARDAVAQGDDRLGRPVGASCSRSTPTSLLDARALLDSALRAAKPDHPASPRRRCRRPRPAARARGPRPAGPIDKVSSDAMARRSSRRRRAEDAGTITA